MCSWERLFDLRRTTWSLSLSGQGSAPPPLHFGVTAHRAQLSCSAWDLSISPASVQLM